MSSAICRTTQASSLAILHTQNTAPVLEFNCLYTHDIRRKQKRWQDGFLRFHTFNKRVMVYDVPRNFIGDAHWKQDEAMQEGDEVTLEKDGVLVQVAESTGRTETDLTELRGSRKKKASREHGSSPMRGAQTPAVRRASGITQKGGTQLKHRSLNALLGTPKGRLGKAALPNKSPFEERRADVENDEWEDGRPPKHQRIDGNGFSLTRTVKTPTVSKEKETPLWARTSDAVKQKKKVGSAPNGQQKLHTKEVIELSDDEAPAEPQKGSFLPGFSSDALGPLSSSAKAKISAKKQQQTTTPAVRSSPPAFQTQNGPPSESMPKAEPATRRVEAVQPLARTSKAKDKPAVEVTGRDSTRADTGMQKKTNVEACSPEAQHRPKVADSTRSVQPATSAPDRPSQTLRMASRPSKKRGLLCQDQLTKKPKRARSENTETAIGSLLNVTTGDDAASETEEPIGTQQRMVNERLAKINRKTTPAPKKTSEDIKNARPRVVAEKDRSCPGSASGRPSANRAEARRPIEVEEDPGSEMVHTRPQSAPGDSSIALAELDQMIMPPDGPLMVPYKPEQPPQRPAVIAPPPKKDRQLRKAVPDVAASETEEPVQRPGSMAPPLKRDRQLRKTVSDVTQPRPDKRAPGAPMRFTPSPSKRGQQLAAPANNDEMAPPSKATSRPLPRAKKAVQRSVSLNMNANGTSAVMLSKPFQTPKAPAPLKNVATQKAPDPWSREAFDLFAWRPPGWDEEKWCVSQAEPTTTSMMDGAIRRVATAVTKAV